LLKKIGVITNADKDADFSYTERVAGWIRERGGEPLFPDERPGGLYEACEMAVVLGGDGTILRAAREAAKYNVPILGINLGGLGYLTDVERDEGEMAVSRAMGGSFRLEKRMMLCIENKLENGPDGRFNALNDVCVGRGGSSKMISVEIYINGDYMDTYRGDGLIISTPTGSTAYNLSAGGPILKPDSEMIAITGICPHSLAHRPWVVSAGDEVRIRLKGAGVGGEAFGREASVVVDGDERGALTPDTFMSVRRSDEHTTIMRTTDYSFYEILRRKMGGSGK